MTNSNTQMTPELVKMIEELNHTMLETVNKLLDSIGIEQVAGRAARVDSHPAPILHFPILHSPLNFANSLQDDIEVVMRETGATKEAVLEALEKCDGDVVDAVIMLSD